MRWCVYGAGAIGGVVGARLSLSGAEVSLVARGAHLEAIRAHGLRLREPDGERVVRLPAADSIAGLPLADGDVVVLAVKTQQTAAALDDLALNAPAGVRVLCLQNGIDNERQALRFFDDVYGASVTLLGSHLEPGIVVAHSAPTVGILQLGRAPAGLDQPVRDMAATLRTAGIRVDLSDDVLRYKRLKLLRNLGNAIEIVCAGPAPAVLERVSAEADAVFAAAGLTLPDAAENIPGPEPVQPSVPREGGSTLQSVLRGAGSVETDYLNGEIALLGRLAGMPAAVNALLQRLAREVGAGRRPLHGLTEPELLQLIPHPDANERTAEPGAERR
ncbi:MAG TPA: 2-dehydropantoate 2-reductase N-terminal domain-containing protein [Gryllotalpicola sp.]